MLPGQRTTLNIADKYVMTLEPIHIADHVFGIQIVSCKRAEVLDAMEIDVDA
jgi:hypothetical protein